MTEDEISTLLSKLQFGGQDEAPRGRPSEASLSRPSIDESLPVSFSPARESLSPMASSMMSMTPSVSGRASVPAFGGELSVQGGYMPTSYGKPLTHHGFSYEKRFADGGHVDAAIHLLRQHFDEGGFLDSLRGMFSGPDYQSTGEVASPTNWGDPESAADFFRADKALRLAQKEQAPEPALTVPRPSAVEARDIPPPSIAAPAPAPAPLAFAPAPEKNPARVAIEEATKLTGRAPTEPSGADNVWTRMLKQESGNRQFDKYGRTVTSPAGALGISQVMPSTGPEAAQLAGLPWSLERLRTDPEYNHALGRAYYDAQLARFGDPILAAAAYNGGPGRVAGALRQAQATGRPWTDFLKPETQNYVRVVGRAEGGEVDGYGGGGDVVAKALAALRGGNKVFPKPQRMFPADARPPGGEYINAATGEAMTGQKPARAVIGVTPEGKPIFLADTEQVDVTGSPGKGSTKTKTNLFKQQAGWKWNEAPEGYENVPTIVSAENRGQHYYGLGADFPKGVDLERYADAPSEPRLRPTTQGNVYPGEQVGSIDVRGREHPVYDMLTIRNLLAGTGAGAAGAAAMPEDIQHEAHGGLVDDALHVVRERHADGEAVGPTMQQRLRETIASIDPERSQDQPVMDPATMGEAWNRARQNYQNFPVQEGEAVARQFVPSVRQEIGAAIAGEGAGRNYGSELRRRAAEFATGSSGLDTGIGALDFVPYAGQALGATDIAHDIGQGNYAGAAEGALVPAAMTAAQRFAGPLGAAGRRAVEIAKDYAKPAAAIAAGVAGLTAAPDEAEAAKLSKLLRVVSPEDRLMLVHNLKSHRLGDIEKLGGLPVPSTAVIKPSQGFTNFGDITMVAPKEMAQPSRTNPTFAADVHTPRFPSVDEDLGMIFKGYTPSGKRRYVPLTLENVVKEMKGNVRGGEGFNYGVGTIRSGVAPQFKSIEQIQNARNLIQPRESLQPMFDVADKKFVELSDKYYPHYKYSGEEWRHQNDLADMLREAGMGKWYELFNAHKSTTPPELRQEAADFLNYLKKMPTEYFEGKPQRAVRLNEFRGAVVPGDITGEQADILRRMGVGRLEQYDPKNPASRIEALQKFGGEQFADGGSVEDRALMLVSKQA